MQLMIASCRRKKSSLQDETHENIDDEVDEYELCNIDKTSLGDKE